MERIQEKLINFKIYEEGGTEIRGLVNAELPELETMTQAVKGAGIAGEYETPIIGHYQKMTLKMKWDTTTPYLLSLSAPKIHKLDLRGAIQVRDSGRGELTSAPLRVTIWCTPKKTAPGKLEPGAAMDASNEFAVNYIKMYLNGQELLEIDQLNFICKIDGVDYLAQVRENLGMNN